MELSDRRVPRRLLTHPITGQVRLEGELPAGGTGWCDGDAAVETAGTCHLAVERRSARWVDIGRACDSRELHVGRWTGRRDTGRRARALSTSTEQILQLG